MKMKFTFFTTIALCLFLSTAISAQINNGSFEDGTDPGGGYITLFAGDTGVTGWSIDTQNIDYIGGYWQASNGVRSIDLNGSSGGDPSSAISQTLTTIKGLTYQITFDMSGNPDGGTGSKFMTVTTDSGSSHQYEYVVTSENSKENMRWESNTFYFTATGTSTTLTFTSNTEGFFGPALDNLAIDNITAQICHRDFGKPKEKTLIVGVSAIAAHLKHGDYAGPCHTIDQ